MQTSKGTTTIIARIAHSAAIRRLKFLDALANRRPSWLSSVDRLTAEDSISFPQRLEYQFAMHTLAIGESKPLFFELILKNTVLFDEIIGDCLLLSVKPAGQRHYQQMERLYAVCHYTNRLPVILSDNNIIRFVRIFAPYGHHRYDVLVQPQCGLGPEISRHAVALARFMGAKNSRGCLWRQADSTSSVQ